MEERKGLTEQEVAFHYDWEKDEVSIRLEPSGKVIFPSEEIPIKVEKLTLDKLEGACLMGLDLVGKVKAQRFQDMLDVQLEMDKSRGRNN